MSKPKTREELLEWMEKANVSMAEGIMRILDSTHYISYNQIKEIIEQHFGEKNAK